MAIHRTSERTSVSRGKSVRVYRTVTCAGDNLIVQIHICPMLYKLIPEPLQNAPPLPESQTFTGFPYRSGAVHLRTEFPPNLPFSGRSDKAEWSEPLLLLLLRQQPYERYCDGFRGRFDLPRQTPTGSSPGHGKYARIQCRPLSVRRPRPSACRTKGTGETNPTARSLCLVRYLFRRSTHTVPCPVFLQTLPPPRTGQRYVATPRHRPRPFTCRQPMTNPTPRRWP